jgi:hypothetical protein
MPKAASNCPLKRLPGCWKREHYVAIIPKIIDGSIHFPCHYMMAAQKSVSLFVIICKIYNAHLYGIICHYIMTCKTGDEAFSFISWHRGHPMLCLLQHKKWTEKGQCQKNHWIIQSSLSSWAQKKSWKFFKGWESIRLGVAREESWHITYRSGPGMLQITQELCVFIMHELVFEYENNLLNLKLSFFSISKCAKRKPWSAKKCKKEWVWKFLTWKASESSRAANFSAQAIQRGGRGPEVRTITTTQVNTEETAS